MHTAAAIKPSRAPRGDEAGMPVKLTVPGELHAQWKKSAAAEGRTLASYILLLAVKAGNGVKPEQGAAS